MQLQYKANEVVGKMEIAGSLQCEAGPRLSMPERDSSRKAWKAAPHCGSPVIKPAAAPVSSPPPHRSIITVGTLDLESTAGLMHELCN